MALARAGEAEEGAGPAPRSQVPEGHLVSAPPLCPPCSAPQGQAESGGMVLVAYAGPVRPAAALRDSVLCLPTDIHSLFVNKPSSSSSSGVGVSVPMT